MALAGLGDSNTATVLVVGGGTIPESDIPALQAKGVQAVFGPGSSIAEIVTYIREHVPRQS